MWLLVATLLHGATVIDVEVGQYGTELECYAAREVKRVRYAAQGVPLEDIKCFYPAG